MLSHGFQGFYYLLRHQALWAGLGWGGRQPSFTVILLEEIAAGRQTTTPTPQLQTVDVPRRPTPSRNRTRKHKHTLPAQQEVGSVANETSELGNLGCLHTLILQTSLSCSVHVHVRVGVGVNEVLCWLSCPSWTPLITAHPENCSIPLQLSCTPTPPGSQHQLPSSWVWKPGCSYR